MNPTVRARPEADRTRSEHGSAEVTTTMVAHTQGVTASTRSIVALDAEPEGWRYSTSHEKNEVLRFNSLLEEVPRAWHGCVLVVEDPHFRPANSGSRSQVYTESELDRLAEMFNEVGITVRLANAMHTAPRRRSALVGAFDADGEPDKARDSEALYAWTAAYGYAEYKRWPKPPPPHSAARGDILRDMVRRQNAMRSIRVGLGDAQADKDRMMQAFRHLRMETTGIDALLTPDTNRDALAAAVKWITRLDGELTATKGRTEKPPRPFFEAVWTACTEADGRLRRAPNGQFIGVRFVTERILQLHDYGRGIGRSQYMYHLLRNDERKLFGKYDPSKPETYHREERAVLRREAQAHTRRLVASLRDYLDDSDRGCSTRDVDMPNSRASLREA